MKGVYLIVIGLLCFAAAFSSYASADGCFSSSCHDTVTHAEDEWTDHEVILFTTCISAACHESNMPAECSPDTGASSSSSWDVDDEDDDSDGITLITDEDRSWVSEMIEKLGVGKIFGIIEWCFNVSAVVAPVLLILLAIAYRAMGDVERGKLAWQGLFGIIGLLLLLKIALDVVAAIKPDLSVISI